MHRECDDGRKILDINKDFYFDEKGILIFTEEYLKRKGYCCNNNCRHCPYK